MFYSSLLLSLPCGLIRLESSTASHLPDRRLLVDSPCVPVPHAHTVQGADLAAMAPPLRICSVEDNELQHHVHVCHDADQQQVAQPLCSFSRWCVRCFSSAERSASGKSIGLVNGISQVHLSFRFLTYISKTNPPLATGISFSDVDYRPRSWRQHICLFLVAEQGALPTALLSCCALI